MAAAASSVNLSLSAEQAAILLPLLDQILSTPIGRISNVLTAPQPSTSSSPTSNTNSSTDYYSADELLQKKRKNSKSSSAQSCLLYTIREAAKVSGLWDKAPYMNDISPQVFQKFYSHVYGICPNLQQSEKELRRRLSDTLMNRQAHLRSQQLLKSPKKRSKKARIALAFNKKDDRSSGASRSSPCTLLTKKLTIGHEVTVYSSTDEMVGSGIYLGQDTDEDEMYGRVLFMKLLTTDTEVSLPSPLGEKFFIHQLEEKKDIFIWRHDYLSTASAQKNPKSSSQSKGRLANSHQPGRTNPDKPVVNDSSTDQQEESESDDRGLSSYEIKRLRRIEENRKVLEQLFVEESEEMMFEGCKGTYTAHEVESTTKGGEVKPTMKRTYKTMGTRKTTGTAKGIRNGAVVAQDAGAISQESDTASPPMGRGQKKTRKTTGTCKSTGTAKGVRNGAVIVQDAGAINQESEKASPPKGSEQKSTRKTTGTCKTTAKAVRNGAVIAQDVGAISQESDTASPPKGIGSSVKKQDAYGTIQRFDTGTPKIQKKKAKTKLQFWDYASEDNAEEVDIFKAVVMEGK